MENYFHSKKIQRSAEVYRLIALIRNQNKKNLLRGYCAKNHINHADIENIRKDNSPHDSMIIGAILKGRQGLLNGSDHTIKKTSNNVFKIISFPSLDWKNEVCYTAGYINSVREEVSEMLGAMRALARLECIETEEALNILLDLSRKYGASNYLSYKLAYLRSTRDVSSSLKVISQIEKEIEHQASPGMHFSALENLSPKISLFVAAKRRICGLVGKVEGNFRKALSLSNFIPTPLNEDDVAGFLLRATESCLLDTLFAVLVVFNLSEEFEAVRKEFEVRLDPEILSLLFNTISHLSDFMGTDIVTDYYKDTSEESYQSLDLYRLSSAFLERRNFAIYRNKLDREFGVRLLAEIINKKIIVSPQPFNDKNLLLALDETRLPEGLPVSLDTFYRTFLFLRFIRNKLNILSLKNDEIKYVFENTLGLEILLTEEEMRTLHLTASPEAKDLTAILSLALFREKSRDPDVDYEFRDKFITHVNSFHNGSILEFVNHLLNDSPQIANYIVVSLDEVALEKMYTLVANASQASEIRRDILKAVGQKLNRIEYYIEADAIATRLKVLELEQYIDASRVYVDSVSMKKWLDSSPSVPLEQFLSLHSRPDTDITSLENENSGDANGWSSYIDEQSEYLLAQIMKEAFEQFCLNEEFGIQSYLGRRIRHNTLDGVTINSVDAVLQKNEYRVAMSSNSSLRKAVESWLSDYKSIVEKLRREYLQVNSKQSSALFKEKIDLDDPIFREYIRRLSASYIVAGNSESLNDLIITFCWSLITPQLENAARFIRTDLLQIVKTSVDKHFSGCHGSAEAQMRVDLHDAVNQIFRKVADWFQVPKTGSVSASVRELCQIIIPDRHNLIEFSGEAIDAKCTGIYVHRLFDCLDVLLQNAQKHGKSDAPILIKACLKRSAKGSILNLLIVEITSTVDDEKYSEAKQRIISAINSKEAGSDMVTEGYTGIKKIKIITRGSEGRHTLRCDTDDEKREFKLYFSLRVEIVEESNFDGDGL